MAAASKETRGKRAKNRARRRRRKIAAAAGAMLLVPVAVAGEPADNTPVADLSALGDVGRGLMGLTDPDSVNTDGTLSEGDQIGADLLRDAGNPDALALDGLDLPNGPLGIPGIMLQAYQRAERTLATTHPGCHMHWSLLASIGRIESGHAGGGKVFGNGDTLTSILGPVLNGGGFAAISDTDGGRLDGDSRWDRAVGAMQFIPSTWAGYASDGNGDRISSPHNVFDATLAAGKYLCSGGMDMANPQQRATAVFRYNHSDTYVRVVLIWADAYAKGVTPLPNTTIAPVPPLQQAGNQPREPITGPVVPTSPPAGGTTSSTTTTTTTTTTPPDCETPPAEPPADPPTSTEPTTTTPTPPECETSTTPTTPSTPTTSSSTSTNANPGSSTTSSSNPGGGGSSPGGGGSSSPGGGGESSTSSSAQSSSSTTSEETTTSPLGP